MPFVFPVIRPDFATEFPDLICRNIHTPIVIGSVKREKVTLRKLRVNSSTRSQTRGLELKRSPVAGLHGISHKRISLWKNACTRSLSRLRKNYRSSGTIAFKLLCGDGKKLLGVPIVRHPRALTIFRAHRHTTWALTAQHHVFFSIRRNFVYIMVSLNVRWVGTTHPPRCYVRS